MADRATLGILAAASLLAGCTTVETPLMLDAICRNTTFSSTGTGSFANCTTAGDVSIVTGLTPDTMAYRFGPNGGSVRIRLQAIQAAFEEDRWTLEALAAATIPGSTTMERTFDWAACGAQCPIQTPPVDSSLDEEAVWVQVVDDLEGQNAGAFGTPVWPEEASIIFAGADFDLIDIRTPGFEPQD